MARYIKMQKLPKKEDINIIGEMRPMKADDVKSVQKILNEYL